MKNNLNTIKRLGLLLQIIMLISIGILLYFEEMNYLWMELGLVAIMFCISMGLLFISEKVDEQQVKEKVKLRK